MLSKMLNNDTKHYLPFYHVKRRFKTLLNTEKRLIF